MFGSGGDVVALSRSDGPRQAYAPAGAHSPLAQIAADTSALISAVLASLSPAFVAWAYQVSRRDGEPDILAALAGFQSACKGVERESAALLNVAVRGVEVGKDRERERDNLAGLLQGIAVLIAPMRASGAGYAASLASGVPFEPNTDAFPSFLSVIANPSVPHLLQLLASQLTALAAACEREANMSKRPMLAEVSHDLSSYAHTHSNAPSPSYAYAAYPSQSYAAHAYESPPDASTRSGGPFSTALGTSTGIGGGDTSPPYMQHQQQQQYQSGGGQRVSAKFAPYADVPQAPLPLPYPQATAAAAGMSSAYESGGERRMEASTTHPRPSWATVASTSTATPYPYPYPYPYASEGGGEGAYGIIPSPPHAGSAVSSASVLRTRSGAMPATSPLQSGVEGFGGIYPVSTQATATATTSVASGGGASGGVGSPSSHGPSGEVSAAPSLWSNRGETYPSGSCEYLADVGAGDSPVAYLWSRHFSDTGGTLQWLDFAAALTSLCSGLTPTLMSDLQYHGGLIEAVPSPAANSPLATTTSATSGGGYQPPLPPGYSRSPFMSVGSREGVPPSVQYVVTGERLGRFLACFCPPSQYAHKEGSEVFTVDHLVEALAYFGAGGAPGAFAGHLNRSDTEAALYAVGPGAFILRFSSTVPCDVALSYIPLDAVLPLPPAARGRLVRTATGAPPGSTSGPIVHELIALTPAADSFSFRGRHYANLSHLVAAQADVLVQPAISAVLIANAKAQACNCFHGLLSYEQTLSRLTTRPPGTFLLRLSQSQRGHIVVAYVDPSGSVAQSLIGTATPHPGGGMPYAPGAVVCSGAVYPNLQTALSMHASLLRFPREPREDGIALTPAAHPRRSSIESSLTHFHTPYSASNTHANTGGSREHTRVPSVPLGSEPSEHHGEGGDGGSNVSLPSSSAPPLFFHSQGSPGDSRDALPRISGSVSASVYGGGSGTNTLPRASSFGPSSPHTPSLTLSVRSSQQQQQPPLVPGLQHQQQFGQVQQQWQFGGNRRQAPPLPISVSYDSRDRFGGGGGGGVGGAPPVWTHASGSDPSMELLPPATQPYSHTSSRISTAMSTSQYAAVGVGSGSTGGSSERLDGSAQGLPRAPTGSLQHQGGGGGGGGGGALTLTPSVPTPMREASDPTPGAATTSGYSTVSQPTLASSTGATGESRRGARHSHFTLAVLQSNVSGGSAVSSSGGSGGRTEEDEDEPSAPAFGSGSKMPGGTMDSSGSGSCSGGFKQGEGSYAPSSTKALLSHTNSLPVAGAAATSTASSMPPVDMFPAHTFAMHTTTTTGGGRGSVVRGASTPHTTPQMAAKSPAVPAVADTLAGFTSPVSPGDEPRSLMQTPSFSADACRTCCASSATLTISPCGHRICEACNAHVVGQCCPVVGCETPIEAILKSNFK